MTITPQEAVIAGAQWNVDEGAWQISGATVSALIAGQHVVKFKEVTGWSTPPSQAVTVETGKTASLTGVYVPRHPPVSRARCNPHQRPSPTDRLVQGYVHREDHLLVVELREWRDQYPSGPHLHLQTGRDIHGESDCHRS